ncbi:SNF2 family N-terminal domain-containing protein [Apiosordaria backusii]|uniref:SNF2 family N-terminal domain-containing protein n=1 Tax=Apiosordaria backusii TaxID=314023 RepID=A0AA40AIQ1_9PEZI|nr:SNF2 family N-terminal domain-containing protein [Apiosordaria backusii]
MERPQLLWSFSATDGSTLASEPAEDGLDAMDVDEEESMCFGMLCDLKAQFYRTRGPGLVRHITDALAEHQEEWVPLDLSLEETFCGISTLAKHLIAVLNKKTSTALAKLHEVADVRYLAYAHRTQLQDGLETLQTSTGNVQFGLDIVVIGPQSESDEIARCLSKDSLYLQEPYFMLEPYPYQNPQYLDIEPYEQEPISCEEQCMDSTTDRGRDVDTAEPSHLELILAAIDNLPENLRLDQAEIDSRIQTGLLEHQRKATSFITGRERGDDTTFSPLWELMNGGRSPMYVSDARPAFSHTHFPFLLFPHSTHHCGSYRHAITGSKSPSPDDIPGGLLADEMGLGKTLSMISAIVTTMSCAESYARSNQTKAGISSTSSTLVIVPSSLLLEGWVEEIEKHVKPGVLTHYKYHGPDRRLDPSNLPSVVISTYGTVTTELSRAGTILRQIHWYRIVLDEAHIIRNWSTKQFRAVNSLSSHIRWCMTGTPVQNGVGDIGSLVRFLRLPVLGDAANFRKHILDKTKLATIPVASSKNDFTNLRLLLSSICLRRNTSVLQLPGVIYECRRPEFSALEREAHIKLIRACKTAIDRSVFGNPDNGDKLHRGLALESSNGGLESLLRLRLFCDQGLALGPPKGGLPSTLDEALSFLQQKGISRCEDCGGEVTTVDGPSAGGHGIHLTNCHVLVCAECLPKIRDDLLRSRSSIGIGGTCPFCGEHDNGENLLKGQRWVEPKAVGDNVPCPSKLQALMDDLCKTVQHEKSIVFSLWMKSLDLVENLLKKHHISFRRVDGSRSKNDRKSSLHDFRMRDDVPVLLMTFGTGSMGLNDLNVARRVHILEPQWNPSVENQAIGRVSRFGQTREVTVIRYVMKKSIEEAVESRQFLKLNLALGGGLHEGKGTNAKGQQASQARRIASDLQEFLTQLMV